MAAQSWLRRSIQVLARANKGAIVNVRDRLSMQGLQPLFAADPIEHVMPQRMIDRQLRMLEVIGRVVVHAASLQRW
jgi:hypothetical protein